MQEHLLREFTRIAGLLVQDLLPCWTLHKLHLLVCQSLLADYRSHQHQPARLRQRFVVQLGGHGISSKIQMMMTHVKCFSISFLFCLIYYIYFPDFMFRIVIVLHIVHFRN